MGHAELQGAADMGADRLILIVEDEYLVASHLAMVVEDLGFTVVGPVATVEEAIAAVGANDLVAAMLDANLEGISSAPIAEALAARRLPFIVVTGYGDLALPSEVMQGAPRVHKPFTSAALAACLTDALGFADKAD